jgi:DNA modification methylase
VKSAAARRCGRSQSIPILRRVPSLEFQGKRAIESYHRVVPAHALEVDRKLSRSSAPRLDGNLIVEGDNLLALKSLLATHARRVKCITIDPPYNTGNESWIYNDNLSQPEFHEWIGRVAGAAVEDASRHDKWCCMMYPRLQLMREMLRDDGAIFVTIDDNEVHHLRLMLDEIFGAENFVVSLVWRKMDSPSSNALERPFSNYHDHVLVYARDASRATFNLLPKPSILDAFPETDENGRRIRLRQLRKNGKSSHRSDRPTMWYAITAPDGSEVWPIEPNAGWEGRWAVAKETFDRLSAAGEIRWKKRPYGWMAYTIERAPKNPVAPMTSIWTDVGQSRQAKQQLNAILGSAHGFETPKPIELIARIVRIATGPNDIVLDCFAGSGTTAHAVLAVNRADASDRKFLLVQSAGDASNKLNICADITRERVARAIEGYVVQNSKRETRVEGLGGEFTYARVGQPIEDDGFDAGSNSSSRSLASHADAAATT